MDSSFIPNNCANKENITNDRHKIWSPIPQKKRKTENESIQFRPLLTQEEDTSAGTSFHRKNLQGFFNPNNSAFRYIFSENNKFISRDPNIQATRGRNTTTSPHNRHPPKVSHSNCSSPRCHPTVHPVSLETQKIIILNPEKPINISEIPLRIPIPSQYDIFNSEYVSNSQEIFMNSFLSQAYAKLIRESSSSDSTPTMQPEKAPEKLADKISRFMKPNENEKKKVHCNCKNSKCLKLYCECLAHGEYCDDYCNCFDCHNCKEKENVRAYALSLILEKNPSFLEGQKCKKKGGAKIVRGKGCNCKKSSCLKKYCECFNSGFGCGEFCKCETCKNPYGRKLNDEGYEAHEVPGFEKIDVQISMAKTISTEATSCDSLASHNSSIDKSISVGPANKPKVTRNWLIQKQEEIVPEQPSFNILSFLTKEASKIDRENICAN